MHAQPEEPTALLVSPSTWRPVLWQLPLQCLGEELLGSLVYGIALRDNHETRSHHMARVRNRAETSIEERVREENGGGD